MDDYQLDVLRYLLYNQKQFQGLFWVHLILYMKFNISFLSVALNYTICILIDIPRCLRNIRNRALIPFTQKDKMPM